MGLDMYLERVIYIGAHKHYTDSTVTGNIEIKNENGRETPIPPIDWNAVRTIREDFIQWRKANAIHKFFVDEVQDGEDDCKEYYVSVDKLKELMTRCEKVLRWKDLALEGNRNAKEQIGLILPPCSGFFFGSTEIDKYYFEDIEYTLEELKNIPESDFNDWRISYSYSSSW